ncbi:MAG: hypothetical protein PWQ67_591 [Clostridia bacterium]|jgi:hypothetical protein|nr:hypothetical protein [Clostridia bacterium]MDN5322137.1 hypothetical protein [Clostridia bacterium]
MPNFHIFNVEASNLRTQIYGSEASTALKTDTGGMLQIRSISDIVSVNNDTPANLKTQIYGSDVTSAMKTDADGALYIRNISDTINVSGTVTATTSQSFNESNNSDVPTGDAFTALTAQDLAQVEQYSFAVYNQIASGNSCDIKVEISPNNTDWFTDISSRTITAGSMDVFVPSRWLRYARLSYKSTSSGLATTIDVYFQYQN